MTHLGWELELKVVKIVRALAWAPSADRLAVVENLTPAALRRAVAEQFDLVLPSDGDEPA